MAEQMADVVVDSVVQSLMGSIKKHLRYLTSCTKYVRDMGTKMKQLDNKKVDVENHVERNKTSNKEIPTYVPGWLEEVRKIKAEVDSIHVHGCFNLKMRYMAGRKALEITRDIDRLIKEDSEANWTDHQIPLGRVDTQRASTSTPSGDKQNDFESRDSTFNEVLKALEADDKSRMIALCGMGGIGKTTMMEQLKKAVDQKKTFSWIVKVVIGEKTDPIAIQQAVADYVDPDLKEQTPTARAERLGKRFEAMSEGGKKKILVILDDVWQTLDLKDIGLSPLPNQGVGFKFLLTSRHQNVCTQMGVDASSIFRVEVMKEPEALNFFRQFAGISDESDPELNQIGKDIVRRCGFLPIAIRTIALTLKNERKDVWDDAFSQLEQHDLDRNLLQIF